MGHSDFIHIREAHGKTYVHLIFVLIYRVYLITNVAGGFLDF